MLGPGGSCSPRMLRGKYGAVRSVGILVAGSGESPSTTQVPQDRFRYSSVNDALPRGRCQCERVSLVDIWLGQPIASPCRAGPAVTCVVASSGRFRVLAEVWPQGGNEPATLAPPREWATADSRMRTWPCEHVGSRDGREGPRCRAGGLEARDERGVPIPRGMQTQGSRRQP